jgi:hypothetical protein
VWEDINSLVFSSGIEVYKKSEVAFIGMDINSSLGRISNKSAKYSKIKKRYKFTD